MPGGKDISNGAIGACPSIVYLERNRLNKLLVRAMDYPLVIVCAGAGYGKTRAVDSFLQEKDTHTAWIQLSERDNAPTRFWENYTSMISMSWPEAGARLGKMGFPVTEGAFSEYVEKIHTITARPGKHVRVFDDFHLLHNREIMHFFERAVCVIPPDLTLILI